MLNNTDNNINTHNNDNKLSKEVPKGINSFLKKKINSYTEIIMSCKNCRHIGVCEYMKHESNKKLEELKLDAENEKNLIRNDVYQQSDIINIDAQIDAKYDKMYIDWKNNIDTKCYYEVTTIIETLQDFDKYDLTDPAIKTAVKTLISNMILNFRMDIVMQHYDIIMNEQRMSTNGESYFVKISNPIIKYRNEINKQISDTAEKLYKLVHGNKQVIENKVTIYDILAKSKPENKQ